jgi:hypothetical protein
MIGKLPHHDVGHPPTGGDPPREAYRGGVPPTDSPAEEPDSAERRWLDDELAGLDPDDPEVKAFGEHLSRIRRQGPGFTVEGYLAGVTDFAESVNRAQGPRRASAVLVVVLLLLGVAFAVWETTIFIVATLLG